jgi:hypothetical protein
MLRGSLLRPRSRRAVDSWRVQTGDGAPAARDQGCRLLHHAGEERLPFSSACGVDVLLLGRRRRRTVQHERGEVWAAPYVLMVCLLLPLTHLLRSWPLPRFDAVSSHRWTTRDLISTPLRLLAGRPTDRPFMVANTTGVCSASNNSDVSLWYSHSHVPLIAPKCPPFFSMTLIYIIYMI